LCGLEGICAELLKSGRKNQILSNIINQYLNGHPVPNQWKLAYIFFICKRGSKKDLNNYRGISVISRQCAGYNVRILIEKEYSNFEEEE